MLHIITKRRQGFTLIELSVIVALLGAFLLGLIATIDPFEQIKKGVDSTRINTANSIYNSLIRSYASTGRIPVSADVTGAPLSSPEGQSILTSLEQFGELKQNFSELTAKDANDIFISATQDGKTISVCFIPESKQFKSDKQTIYDKSGSIVDCSQTSCYVCTGQSAPTATEQQPSGSIQLELCKSLDAECEINNSFNPCCSGLTCVPYNQNSGNGKCKKSPPKPSSTPLPTTTPTMSTPTVTPSCATIKPTPTTTSKNIGKTCIGNLLPNGSFEIDADKNTVPDGWKMLGSIYPGEGVVCSDATHGSCSFLMKPATGHNATLEYGTVTWFGSQANSTTVAGPAGTIFNLSFDSKILPGTAPSTTASVTFVISYGDGQTKQTVLAVNPEIACVQPAGEWLHAETTVVADKPYMNIYVKAFTHGIDRTYIEDNLCLTKDR